MMRIPATACAVASLLVIVLITRELGGGHTAQALSAWGLSLNPPTILGW